LFEIREILVATTGSIAIEGEDGHVEAVHCQYDGYLSGVGSTLIEFHNAYGAARAIIELGDLQSLHRLLTPPPGSRHYVDRHAPDVTVAYGREYGRSIDETRSVSYDTDAAWMQAAGAKFYYVWRGRSDGAWFTRSGDQWIRLTLAIELEQAEKGEALRQLREALGHELPSELRKE